MRALYSPCPEGLDSERHKDIVSRALKLFRPGQLLVNQKEVPAITPTPHILYRGLIKVAQGWGYPTPAQ